MSGHRLAAILFALLPFAAGAADGPGTLGPRQGGSAAAPAAPEEQRPMEQTPQRPVNRDRQRFEQRASRDLRAWEVRLQDFTAKATAAGPEQQGHAVRLNRELTTAKQHWEQLRQTDEQNWERQKTAFDQAFGRFKADWQRWAGQTAEKP